MTVKCLISDSIAKKIDSLPVDIVTHRYEKNFDVQVKGLFENIKTINLYHCESSDLRFYEPRIVGDEKFYRDLHKYDWYYLDEKSEYELAKNYVNSGDRVLEVGCGKGAFSKYLKGNTYVGLELNPDAVTQARANGLDVRNTLLDAHVKDNHDGYDIICCFQVLEHVEDPKLLIDTMKLVVKEKGKIIISVPSYDSFVSLSSNNILNMPPHHLTIWSDKSLAHIANVCGLELIVIEHERLSSIHKRWYANTLAQVYLMKLFNRPIPRLLGQKRNFDWVLLKISSIIGYVLEKLFTDDRFLPNGHTVTAIYQKPSLKVRSRRS